MAEETIFSKIVRKEIASDILYQDELVTAFRDITEVFSSISVTTRSHRIIHITILLTVMTKQITRTKRGAAI